MRFKQVVAALYGGVALLLFSGGQNKLKGMESLGAATNIGVHL